MQLEKYLEELEKRIDDDEEIRLMADWTAFTEGDGTSAPFSPKRHQSRPEAFPWPVVHINRAIADIDLMLLHQYGACSARLAAGSGELLCVRANYGTSILPSLFGVDLYIMAEEHNTLPTSRPIQGGADAIRRLVDKGVPDLFAGYGNQVFKVGWRFRQISDRYPKIGQHVHVYHPDLQGPMDICELLAGSEIFLMLVDEPELMHELLSLVTETYIRFLREWHKIWPPAGSHSVHWGWLQKGHIMIRNDSMMNLSPAMFSEFVRPYDQRLYDAFGGGAMHFCGRGDHYIEQVADMPGVYAVNMSQPQYNNMEMMFRHTAEKGIRLLGCDPMAAADAMSHLGAAARAVHCTT